MDTEASNAIFLPAIMPRLFPALGPALLISVGYIDVGKWATAVDGGTRFGFDLMLFMLAFNCIAILFQYLAARITVVTGKNISQICREEYDRPTCTFLGIQAVLSMIVLDLTMIMGIAHGLNLLLGLDLFVCVILSATDAMLFPLFITLMNKCKTEMLFVGTASFVLLIYMFGVLISQSETPLTMSVSLPMLRGENAYILMGLLGTNIMPHNFYIHSFIIQKQRTLLKLSMGTLCHDHFLAILFIFSGIFLVNYVVMLSAATVFHSAGLSVLTFQDTLLLMDQVFRSPLAPFAFFLVLFISSQVTALTCALGGQGVLHDFFGIEPPVWLYRFTVKALATIPALYCAWNFGAEGIYQLLVSSQIISAMLLPSSVIPLLRASSSTSIMGAFKISFFVEILGLFAFLWMLASNAIFVVEMLSGDSSWMSNLGWGTGSGMTLPYLFVLVTACASIALMLWLAATPLKSASDRPNIRYSLDVQQNLPALCEDKEEDGLKINNIRFDIEEEPLSGKATLEKSVVGQLDNSVEFNLGLAETITPSSHEPHNSAGEENCTLVSSSLTSSLEVPTSTVEQASVETVNDVSSDESAVKRTEYKDPVGNTRVEGDIMAVVKDNKESYVWEPEESPAGTTGNLAISACEGPGSFRSVTGKSEEVGSGSGSLSRLAGLGRSARRQLAAILDEFWGHLYDFHGQATQEAKSKGIDANLGLEQKPSAKADIVGVGYTMNYFSDAEQRSMCLTKSKDCESTRQQRMMGSSESSYEAQKVNPLLSSYIQSLNAYEQNSSNNLLDASERRYSSLQLPSYSEDRDYQPATIHGYQISSYLSRIAERNMDSMSIPSDPSTPKSSPFIPNFRDTLAYSVGQNGLGSLHASNVLNPAVPATTRLQAARLYCESSLAGTSENVESSVSSKKYHSLPDISGLVIPYRNTSSANRNAQWSNSVGSEPSAGQSPYDQSLYASTASRATGVSLPFELSTSNRYRDTFPLPPISSFDAKSLWSKQPFEHFGIPGKPRSRGHEGLLQGTISDTESEAKLLLSFRCCIMRLLKLEGSDWLFQQNGGFDEELIDQVAARYKFLYEAEDQGGNRVPMDDPHISSDRKFGLSEDGFAQYPVPSVPHCGEGCIWQVGLIVSFGVWCIRRILELSIMESRPELWGKYTYVLNRLQGILDLAFFKPRLSIFPCFCLQIPSMHMKKTSPLLRHGLSPTTGKAVQGQYTSAGMLLDLIKDVEAAVSGRKGRTGTAAGDVAFPKGKENLASVLKRYKRRLSNKSAGTHEGGLGPRKIPTPAFSTQLSG